ncbi:MAG: hypothetical protein NAG76_16560 [Candidatus Pristimantibacillus lignocellulolyticus]|uniref:Uncharacterized protein n=1 Tax=Candidatus Pristimantibacillus lignocellulolyticus TaxID=2994561 RepID=A0A9J6ZBX4_9BACL|nr:MAG: hypothetical protein NAG76_16560 [Candidatus Pristimantibacillus lignocellulolyticus]
MFGTWRWNLSFGVFGFLLIMLFSLTNNPLITSLIRGTYALITFFLLAYPVRFVCGVIINPNQGKENALQEDADQSLKGTTVNLVTPDEDEDLNEVLRAQMTQTKTSTPNDEVTDTQDLSQQFQPLKPTQLVNTDKMESEELTKVIRHLTGE